MGSIECNVPASFTIALLFVTASAPVYVSKVESVPKSSVWLKVVLEDNNSIVATIDNNMFFFMLLGVKKIYNFNVLISWNSYCVFKWLNN